MKLRVLMLADINSTHTQKWALGLAADKIEIGIFSLNHSQTDWYSHSPCIRCLNQKSKHQSFSFFNKISNIFYLPFLLVQIFRFKPTVIHSHYASSYGLLGALSFFKPFLVSAWGSDVMEFPRKGFLQKLILKFVFMRAYKICATSQCLKNEIANYTPKIVLLYHLGWI